MTTSVFQQPDFTTMDAATYKNSIDNSVAVLAETGLAFAPHEMATPGAGITLEAATLPNGTVIAAQDIVGIGAPSVNPRIDRIWFDANSGTVKRQVGTEAASPVPPAVQFGGVLIAQIYLAVPTGPFSITNDMIIDERSFVQTPIASFSGGYMQIVDGDGLLRILIGRGGFDNRVIVRLHTSGTDSKLEIQDSGGGAIMSLDGAGNLKTKGTITPSTTP
uniref:Uncharacterized protein n=1 Tax=Pseudomonas phage Pavpe01 TaxID=3138545 RepID=A0AAU6W0T3_9VIRU